MVDFTTATVTCSVKRLYKPIDNFDDFCEIMGMFLNNTSMNFLEKELKSESYTAVVFSSSCIYAEDVSPKVFIILRR